MSAKNVDLSKAIVEKINETELSMAFVAKRRAVPFSRIEEITEVQVIVFDGPKSIERETRQGFRRTYKPTLAVLKKLPSGDDATRLEEADMLQALVEEIEETLTDVDLVDLSFVGFDEEQERDPYNVELLKGLGAFAVATTLQYTG